MHEQQNELPIVAAKDSIMKMVKDNDIIIIIGETGSGKTTQLPQLFLDQYKEDIKMVITQPRRVATVSVAHRVQDELQCFNTTVAYRIRFQDTSDSHTKILFVTDGILVRELLKDPYLLKYSIIMVDEAHERSVATDVLLGTCHFLYYNIYS